MGGSSGFQQSALTAQPTYNCKLLLLHNQSRRGWIHHTTFFLFSSFPLCTGLLWVHVHDCLLVPANPNIGVLHHRAKYYAFSSKEAADGFAGNPDG